jgi:hypothetical protein
MKKLLLFILLFLFPKSIKPEIQIYDLLLTTFFCLYLGYKHGNTADEDRVSLWYLSGLAGSAFWGAYSFCCDRKK